MHREDGLLQGAKLQLRQCRETQCSSGSGHEWLLRVGHIQVDPGWQHGANEVRTWRKKEHLDTGAASAEVLRLGQELPISDTVESALCWNKVSQEGKIDEVGEVRT